MLNTSINLSQRNSSPINLRNTLSIHRNEGPYSFRLVKRKRKPYINDTEIQKIKQRFQIESRIDSINIENFVTSRNVEKKKERVSQKGERKKMRGLCKMGLREENEWKQKSVEKQISKAVGKDKENFMQKIHRSRYYDRVKTSEMSFDEIVAEKVQNFKVCDTNRVVKRSNIHSKRSTEQYSTNEQKATFVSNVKVEKESTKTISKPSLQEIKKVSHLLPCLIKSPKEKLSIPKKKVLRSSIRQPNYTTIAAVNYLTKNIKNQKGPSQQEKQQQRQQIQQTFLHKWNADIPKETTNTEDDMEIDEFLTSKNLLNDSHQPRELQLRKGKYRNSLAGLVKVIE